MRLPTPPECFLKVQWKLISNILFLLGSLCWIVWPLWCWFDDHEYCHFSGTLAAFMFLGSSPLMLIDMWIARAAGEPRLYAGGVTDPASGTWEATFEHIDWQLLANVTFFLGTLGDISSSLVSFFLGPGAFNMLTDVLATHLWAVSGISALCDWFLEQRSRRVHSAPVQMTLNPWRVSANPIVLFDWFGAGDWCFLPGGLLYAFGAYSCTLWDNVTACWIVELAAAVCFFVDALLYFPQLRTMSKHPELYTRIAAHKSGLIPMIPTETEQQTLLP